MNDLRLLKEMLRDEGKYLVYEFDHVIMGLFVSSCRLIRQHYIGQPEEDITKSRVYCWKKEQMLMLKIW